ncbi:hypothetical protein [Rubinisphaera sp.]|uniref:hypothetical protein n=1 Tax=Rubinisphaera sp. TaxID=2024857 RepID=UPI0025F35DE5|nr:hypothetical protein [Rubinisphaera sp.]
MPNFTSRQSIGASIFGPIVVDALVRLEHRLQILADKKSVVLFCARGGLVLQDLLRRIGRRIPRRIEFPARSLMVSRIAAARYALVRNPAAVASIIESELNDQTCHHGAIAFSGPKNRRWLDESGVARDHGWDQLFTVDRFLSLLGRDAIGRRIRDGIEQQAFLFGSHFEHQVRDAERIILCDTGVFGSTARYLSAAQNTHFEWRCLMLVRANYKRLACPHFDFTEGIICERDRYDPKCPESAMLMYWPCIEAMLEPDLPSVEWFLEEADGRIVSNLEIECNKPGGWNARLVPCADSLRAGIIDYIETLTPSGLSGIRSEAEEAFRVFRRMIVRPTRRDVEMLAVGTRPLGFGSNEAATFSPESLNGGTLFERFGRIRQSMWPEGELRRQLPVLATPLLEVAEWGRLLGSLLQMDRGANANRNDSSSVHSTGTNAVSMSDNPAIPSR